MIVSKPQFVILDTATIATAAKRPNDVEVKELSKLFCRGDWIPFITAHHLEELAFHESDDEFKRRLDFLQSLTFVGYLAQLENKSVVGNSVHLRTYEIEFLAAHPDATHEQIIAAVRPKVCSGFCSGRQLVNAHLEFFELFRKKLAPITRRNAAELANLTHFPVFDMNERLPAKGESIQMCSKEEAILRSKRLASQLERQMLECGDYRGINPRLTATSFMQEVIANCRDEDFVSGKYSYDEFLERVGVRRDRLPSNPKQEDFLSEVEFVGQMGLHAKLLLKNKDELLRSVRKEQLPSWVVWDELDRRIRKLPRAEIGNGNDKHIASFGLYVDVLNADKRIAEMLEQASRKSSLLLQVHKRVPKKRGFAGVLEALKN